MPNNAPENVTKKRQANSLSFLSFVIVGTIHESPAGGCKHPPLRILSNPFVGDGFPVPREAKRLPYNFYCSQCRERIYPFRLGMHECIPYTPCRNSFIMQRRGDSRIALCGPSVEIRLHFHLRCKLRFGSVQPSPATLVRVAFDLSNLDGD